MNHYTHGVWNRTTQTLVSVHSTVVAAIYEAQKSPEWFHDEVTWNGDKPIRGNVVRAVAAMLDAGTFPGLKSARPIDPELSMVLEDIPTNLPDVGNVPAPNAFVCKRTDHKGEPQIEIWPTVGGWLGCPIDQCIADVAPFAV